MKKFGQTCVSKAENLTCEPPSLVPLEVVEEDPERRGRDLDDAPHLLQLTEEHRHDLFRREHLVPVN